MKYYYKFELVGEIKSDSVLENEVWVDVGNRSKDGVFDHHQDQGLHSAFETVMECTDHFEGLKHFLSTHNSEDSQIMFHVHKLPDIDCVFSVFAIQKMIKEGASNPKAAFKESTRKKILEYVNTIDIGKKKIMSQMTLYAYFCKIGTKITNPIERSNRIINEGLKLAEMVVDALDKGQEIDLFTAPVDEYLDLSQLDFYSDLKETLKKAEESYEEDKKRNHVTFISVGLLNKETRKVEYVSAAIWEQMASDEDLYVLAREKDKCVLIVYYPKILPVVNDNGTTHVTISLNPDVEGVERFTLLPFAEILEQMEQIEEEKLYKEKGRYRRDHSSARGTSGIFAQLPFSETSDPWFINKERDLISSPREGSLLPYERILSIIKNSSSIKGPADEPKLTSLIRKASYVGFRKKDVNGLESDIGGDVSIVVEEKITDVSFGDVYSLTREKLASMRNDSSYLHLLVEVKVDPVMLRYNNAILQACCLNMVRKSDYLLSKENLMYLNYRSFLYTDQSITIIAVADTGEPLSFLDENIEESRICLDIRNLLEHRQKLRMIGMNLSDKIQVLSENLTEIDKFNKQIVLLSTRIEEDNIIMDPLEQDVYASVKSSFKIDELRKSVIDSANLLIKNAEQEEDKKEKTRDNLLQAGVGLMAILALFSAWVDSYDFISKFADGSWDQLKEDNMGMAIFIGFILLFIFVLGIIGGVYAVKAFKAARKDMKKSK